MPAPGHRPVLAAGQHPDGARQQRVGHRRRVVDAVGAVPGPDVPEDAEPGVAPEGGRQAAVSGMAMPGPAAEVAPCRAMALDAPHDLDAGPVRHREAGTAAAAPELQPVRGIEEPAGEAGAGLGNVEAERRPRQGGHRQGPAPAMPGTRPPTSPPRRTPPDRPHGRARPGRAPTASRPDAAAASHGTGSAMRARRAGVGRIDPRTAAGPLTASSPGPRPPPAARSGAT